jgi:hypothetical protein
LFKQQNDTGNEESQMKKLFFTLMLTLILASGAFAVAPDFTGAWTITRQSPMGEHSDAMTIVQKGESLTVTIQSPRGDQIYTGSCKDAAVSWSGKRRRPDGVETTVTYSGKLEGETLKGTVQLGDRGTFGWSAVRVKPAAT